MVWTFRSDVLESDLTTNQFGVRRQIKGFKHHPIANVETEEYQATDISHLYHESRCTLSIKVAMRGRPKDFCTSAHAPLLGQTWFPTQIAPMVSLTYYGNASATNAYLYPP
jgi:hypothetical protein